MKLKTGTTYWSEKNGASREFPRLRQDVRCDVAVVGAGITGALVADRLTRAGMSVVMVDKRPPATGSTSASTALLLYDTDPSMAELSQAHGKESAERVYQLGLRAIGDLGALVRAARIECAFRQRKCLYVASDAAGLKSLRGEFHRRRQAGLPCEFISRTRLEREFGLHFPGAIYSSGCAEVDAMALTRGLISRGMKTRRLRIFQGAKVRRVRTAADHVVLRTSNHRSITARYVVVATGYECAPFLEDGMVELKSTYVIGSQPQPHGELWKDECLVWETARPYFYLRTTADHRVLIGGEDVPFSSPARRDRLLASKARKLQRRFSTLFPKIEFKVDYRWTGTFAETKDGLPFIGPRDGEPRILYALGYGGNGITFSQIAAGLIEKMCHGRNPKDARLFRFNR